MKRQVDDAIPLHLYNMEGVLISKTQRGRAMLIFEGYKYVENRQSKKNHFWRCARYVKHGCRATLVTSKHLNVTPLIRQSGHDHSHPTEMLARYYYADAKQQQLTLLTDDIDIIEPGKFEEQGISYVEMDKDEFICVRDCE
jgi:hypothetical protein